MLQVVPYTFYRHVSGKTASFWGAAPWVNEVEKADWSVVTEGFTVYNVESGTFGMGRPPFKTREEADQYVAEYNVNRINVMQKAIAMRETINAPVKWVKNQNVYDCGEGYTITVENGAYIIAVKGDSTDYPIYKSLKKAKDWCEQCIRTERKNNFIGE